MSVVVPIGVIVVVAIICVVIAVLSSANRADETAAAHEREILSRALVNQAERALRDVESVVTSESLRNAHAGGHSTPHGLSRQLKDHGHHAVFLFNGEEHVTFADSERPEEVARELKPLLDHLHGRAALNTDLQVRPHSSEAPRAALVQSVLGRPALVAGTAIGSGEIFASALGNNAPIIVSIKFVTLDVVDLIRARFKLSNLRVAITEPPPPGDHVFALPAANGADPVRFVWTPRRPGADIVNSVLPYIGVALAGFALLAAFVLRYMRRTAAAIAVGESQLRHLAMHDPLCGLPNRIFFSERLEAVIAQVRDGSSPAAVFYIDLDHFKEVNDTLGHPIGDELIRNVTLRLARALRGDDLVARLGGDEFAIISSVGADQRKMMGLAQRIISELCEPYSINNHSIVIGASIGIAVIDKNCRGSADVMRYADMALYRAKNEGRNRACIYDSAMEQDLSNRKQLEIDLRAAVDSGELRLLYQPLVDSSGEKMLGVEALCRWSHPQRGDVAPSEFVPVAEHSGLIIELGEWVLRRACMDGKAWPKLPVSVNVSPLQFRRSDFVDSVERTLNETGFDPTRLELEVTESTLIGNFENAEAAMRRLKSLGVRLALDDFGTGYSSLLYLRRFPFDKLKIDRSFVRSIETGSDAAAIVHAIVSLGRGLGMKVTAEGVETADQHLFLRAAGVHSMQGYRFGKPMARDDITARLAAGGVMPAAVPTALAG